MLAPAHITPDERNWQKGIHAHGPLLQRKATALCSAAEGGFELKCQTLTAAAEGWAHGLF